MSLDPVLLAGFLAPPYGRFLDIGCGAGPLSFLLLARDPDAIGRRRRDPAAARRPRAAAGATTTGGRRGWRSSKATSASAGRKSTPAAFDLVVTNPPYRTVESSPPSPDRERALAHHEITLRLAGVDRRRGARRAPFGPRGRHPAGRARRRALDGPGRARAPARSARATSFRAQRSPPSRILVEASPSARRGIAARTSRRWSCTSPTAASRRRSSASSASSAYDAGVGAAGGVAGGGAGAGAAAVSLFSASSMGGRSSRLGTSVISMRRFLAMFSGESLATTGDWSA